MSNATPPIPSFDGERWAHVARYGEEYSCSTRGRVYSFKSCRLLNGRLLATPALVVQ